MLTKNQKLNFSANILVEKEIEPNMFETKFLISDLENQVDYYSEVMDDGKITYSSIESTNTYKEFFERKNITEKFVKNMVLKNENYIKITQSKTDPKMVNLYIFSYFLVKESTIEEKNLNLNFKKSKKVL